MSSAVEPYLTHSWAADRRLWRLEIAVGVPLESKSMRSFVNWLPNGSIKVFCFDQQELTELMAK